MPASESVFVERGPKNVKTPDEEGPSAMTFEGGAHVRQEIAGDVHSRVQVLDARARLRCASSLSIEAGGYKSRQHRREPESSHGRARTGIISVSILPLSPLPPHPVRCGAAL